MEISSGYATRCTNRFSTNKNFRAVCPVCIQKHLWLRPNFHLNPKPPELIHKQRCDGSKTRAGRRGRYAVTGRRGIFCSARSPGGRARRRKNCEKNPANCAAAVVSRARRRLSMRGVARSDFQHDCLDMFTKRHTETEPHRHTETRTQVVLVTASARHCPCPGCKSLLGHGPAPARELVCTVQAPAARC